MARRGGRIPIAPKPPKQHGGSHPSGGGTSSSSGGSSSGGGSGSSGHSSLRGGGGSPKDPYAAAQARADAKERRANRKSSNKYIENARTLQGQVAALRHALGKDFKHALDIKLQNISLTAAQQDRVLVDEYNQRLASLKGAADDNTKAADAQTYANLTNRGRERASAMAEAFNNGAGESDVLRSQEAALRNWNANQSEIARGYFDTLRSVNSGITDLNADTKTARINSAAQANKDRESAYQDYYNQRSETFTALGNVKGQQAEYYGLANEAVGSKKTRKQQREASHGSAAAFMNASRAEGQAYRNPGVGQALMQWKGAGEIEGALNGSSLGQAASPTTIKKPEGAGLRKWED